MIRAECQNCGRTIDAPDNLSGKSARCPGCQSSVLLVKAVVLANKNPDNPLGIRAQNDAGHAPATIEELLASIDKNLSAIKGHVGCLLYLAIGLIVLGFIGGLISSANHR